MRIALDAMGGDHAPGPIVAGAVQAVAEDPEIQVVLVGDRTPIEAAVERAGGRLGDRLTLHHCAQQVTMEESPVEALRKKPDNSISRTWQLMAERKVDGIVSAGNTGAMVAGGLRLRRFLKGVRRPGIATVMPTLKGPCVLIDVGANVSPKPTHLYAYGVMGSIFARHILQIEHPTIGLMNVGAEEAKGNELAKETFALFNSGPLSDQFVGNIEGRDIHRGVERQDRRGTDGRAGARRRGRLSLDPVPLELRWLRSPFCFPAKARRRSAWARDCMKRSRLPDSSSTTPQKSSATICSQSAQMVPLTSSMPPMSVNRRFMLPP